MIDKEWLDKQELLFIDYYYDDFLYCRAIKRAIQIEISKLVDDTYLTNIYFIQDGIYLFHLCMEGSDMELSRQLLTEWLINHISYDNLIAINKNIHRGEVYDAYIKGEDAVIEYYWNKVKADLQGQLAFMPTAKLIEALDLCLNSQVLKKFVPYISVGRLCLSKTTVGQPYSSDGLCLRNIDNKIEVANYEHENIHLFDSTSEAVKYVEDFYE